MDNIYEGLETVSERETAYENFVRSRLKWNYAAHFLHDMFGMTGFRLVNAPTFVPASLHLLSGSDFIVGLGLALQQFGGVISAVVGAAHIEHRKHVLKVSLVLGSTMRLQILGLALAGWLLSGHTLIARNVWGNGYSATFLAAFFLTSTGLAMIGLLTFAFLIASTVSNLFWGPLTGGIIAASLGYLAVFWTSTALHSIALVLLVFRVKEPRRRALS